MGLFTLYWKENRKDGDLPAGMPVVEEGSMRAWTTVRAEKSWEEMITLFEGKAVVGQTAED